MRNETNKRNLFIAIGLGLLFILIPNTGISSESFIVNQNFILSLIIYTILCYLALYCYSSNKIAGIVLLISISFISPNLYKNFKGELYPITIVIFAAYFAYIFGIGRFKQWKSSL